MEYLESYEDLSTARDILEYLEKQPEKSAVYGGEFETLFPNAWPLIQEMFKRRYVSIFNGEISTIDEVHYYAVNEIKRKLKTIEEREKDRSLDNLHKKVTMRTAVVAIIIAIISLIISIIAIII